MTSHTAESARIVFSRNNLHVKRIRDLQRREERERTGLFFVEGMRLVSQALHHGVRLETLLISPPLLTHPFARKVARQQQRAGTPLLSVPADVYHSVSLAEEPQGIGAVVRQRWTLLEQANPRTGLCRLALDSIRSPGNLGTILRTCEAVGGAGVILLDESVDPYDPATVRASMGAMFSQQLVRASPEEFLDWKRKHGCLLVGTSPHASADYRSVRYEPPVVLFMGGERKGLPMERQLQCDAMVRIPMAGSADSLNVAVATGVLLYEVFGRRHGSDSLPLAFPQSAPSRE